jgi:hypothetical protein
MVMNMVAPGLLVTVRFTYGIILNHDNFTALIGLLLQRQDNDS